MRVNQQAGFVLHSRPYRETSLIVDVVSRDYGRLALIAKGARRNKIRWRTSLQPFQLYLISWTGKGEMPVLTQTEYQKSYLDLDYRSRVCGFYANELLSRTLQRHDPHPSLFDAYSDLLHSLEGKRQRELALRRFEKRLLNDIGYALILDNEVDSGEPIQDDLLYQYVPESGPIFATQQHFQVTGQRQWESSLIVPGIVLTSIKLDQYQDDNIMREAKRFMRSMLQPLLGRKPLTSRSLLYHSGV